MDDYGFTLKVQAIELEAKYFGDMTLEEFPQILAVLDEWGDCRKPTIDTARIIMLDSTGDTLGTTDYKNRTISIVYPTDVSTLAHEMIHWYELQLDDLNPNIRQLLACTLWTRLQTKIEGLAQRAERFLEVVSLNELESEGGEHDLLFLLKSYDMDLNLGLPLGSTFGYGGFVA